MPFSLSKIFTKVGKQVPVATQRVVGVDIGSSSVKVVEFEEKDGAVILRSYGELQLGPYADKELGNIAEPVLEKYVEALVDVIRESGISAKEGILAIPLHASFMTVVPITADSQELGAKIPVEARKYIPVPLPDVTLDWRELHGSGDSESNNMHEVLIVAVENNALSRYKNIINMSGIKAQPAEIEAFSSTRCLWKAEDEILTILDLGGKTAKLYITRNGLLERVHRVRAGGALITQRLSEMLNISFDDAENIKRSATLDSEQGQEVLKATNSVLMTALQEFRRILDQYEMRSGESVKRRLVVSGGVSLGVGVKEMVADVMARDIEVVDAFSKVAYPAFMEDTLQQISPIFHVAVGAALRQFE